MFLQLNYVASSNTFLLCDVQSILKVNIDPTAPSLVTTLSSLGETPSSVSEAMLSHTMSCVPQFKFNRHHEFRIVRRCHSHKNASRLLHTYQHSHCCAGQQSALPIGNMPDALSACALPPAAAASAAYGEGGRCGAAGISLLPRDGALSSTDMSQQLLNVRERLPIPW